MWMITANEWIIESNKQIHAQGDVIAEIHDKADIHHREVKGAESVLYILQILLLARFVTV